MASMDITAACDKPVNTAIVSVQSSLREGSRRANLGSKSGVFLRSGLLLASSVHFHHSFNGTAWMNEEVFGDSIGEVTVS